MAQKLIISGNYLIVEVDGVEENQFALTQSTYGRPSKDFKIIEKVNNKVFVINFEEVGKWEDDANVAFTEATLTTFLRVNLGKSSGGSTSLPTIAFKNTTHINTEVLDGIYLQAVDIVGTGSISNPQYKANTKYVIIDGVISEFTGSSTPPIIEVSGTLPDINNRALGFFYDLINSADTAITPNGLYKTDNNKNLIYLPHNNGNLEPPIPITLYKSATEAKASLGIGKKFRYAPDNIDGMIVPVDGDTIGLTK